MTIEERLAEIRARYEAGEYLTWEDGEWLLELAGALEAVLATERGLKELDAGNYTTLNDLAAQMRREHV